MSHNYKNSLRQKLEERKTEKIHSHTYIHTRAQSACLIYLLLLGIYIVNGHYSRYSFSLPLFKINSLKLIICVTLWES